MPGRIPKERKRYVLWADGVLVEVSRAVYLEWHQARRREKYQQEQGRKYGVCSLDRLVEEGKVSELYSRSGPEEVVFRDIYRDKLYDALGKLSERDIFLIYLLYFKEMTVKEAAQLLGCSRKSVEIKERER